MTGSAGPFENIIDVGLRRPARGNPVVTGVGAGCADAIAVHAIDEGDDGVVWVSAVRAGALHHGIQLPKVFLLVVEAKAGCAGKLETEDVERKERRAGHRVRGDIIAAPVTGGADVRHCLWPLVVESSSLYQGSILL